VIFDQMRPLSVDSDTIQPGDRIRIKTNRPNSPDMAFEARQLVGMSMAGIAKFLADDAESTGYAGIYREQRPTG
jgi:hypothetical protein